MKTRFERLAPAIALLLAGAATSFGQTPEAEGASYVSVEMPPFAVSTLYSANEEPAASFATAVTRLRYAPEVDLQSRGLPEAQSDVVVRGSVFEQAGIMVGAIPFFDPQTGHYTAELPFAPAMLSAPVLELGSVNALHGFNSTVATVHYGWAQIENQGEVSVGFGSDSMQYQSLYYGKVLATGNARWAIDLSGARAEGDGTIENGDYEFARLAGRVQRATKNSQTDFYAGYLDKFYGWPGLYIGNAFGVLFPETDDYQATVLGMNHRQAYGDGSFWETSAAFRQIEDDYEFNRNAPSRDFEHLTRTWSAGVRGKHRFSSNWGIDHQWTVLHDDLVRSSSLMFGDPARGNDFTERNYLHVGLAPEFRWRTTSGALWKARAGLNADASSEDNGHIGGLLRVERERVAESGTWTVFGDLSKSSQVPGYTALRSNPVGLFGGNPNLGREYATVLEVGGRWEHGPWMISAAVFGRYDDDVVDWTYTETTPTARQANPVEVENLGVEWIGGYTARTWRLQLSYVYLDKQADYQNATVDASFYVLNHARHRLTLSTEYRVRENLDIRLDAAWRDQVANRLRTSGDEAFHASVSIYWRPAAWEGIEFSLLADNLTDSDFQDLPGTPAVGRHFSGRVTYRW